MIYKTAYETTIGSSIELNKIIKPLKKALVQGLIDSTTDLISSLKIKPVFILTSDMRTNEIPQFIHPILISDPTISKIDEYLCIDARPFIKNSENNYIPSVCSMKELEPFIRNRAEFDFIRAREIINMLWLAEGCSIIASTFAFADSIYHAWIADNISKKYSLDMREQLTVSVICHLFYQTLFVNNQIDMEFLKTQFVPHTIKVTKAPAEFVEVIVDQIKSFSTVEDLCETIANLVGGIKLRDFNAGILITILRNTWNGVNAPEILAVSLEHPPTFISLVYISLVERTYKSSALCRIAEKFAKQELANSFVNAFTHMIQDHIIQTSTSFNHETFKDRLNDVTITDLSI